MCSSVSPTKAVSNETVGLLPKSPVALTALSDFVRVSAGFNASVESVVADDFDEQSTAFGDDDPHATSAGTRARVTAKTPAAIQRGERRGDVGEFIYLTIGAGSMPERPGRSERRWCERTVTCVHGGGNR